MNIFINRCCLRIRRAGFALLKLLLNVTACVWWFDPVVLIAKSVAARDVELDCDEAVMAGRSEGGRGSDTQTDDWESFYRDVVAAGLRVAE